MTEPSEMVKRVARVLEPQAWAALGTGDKLAYKDRRTSSLRKAAAVIEALREPTPEMVEEGGMAEINGSFDTCFVHGESAREVWTLMIDAALAPAPAQER